jgi:hypothetical protein
MLSLSGIAANRLRIVAAALGLATICMAKVLEPLVSSTHDLVYHWSGPATSLFGPPAVVLAGVFLLLLLLLVSAERPGRWRMLVWTAVLLFLPWVALHQVRGIWPNRLPDWVRLPPFVLALAVWPLLALICYRYGRAELESIIGAGKTIFAFMAISGCLVVGQLAFFWWKAEGLNQMAATPDPTYASAAPRTRIIWILMDELSYQQLYEHRYPGLRLPAFDRLQGEATVFTDVTPAANYTEQAVPVLFSGRPISAASATSQGMLLVRAKGAKNWHRYDDRTTVFEDALRDGYRTRVAGWYNPYCRILKHVLDSCAWADAYMDLDGIDPNKSFGSNVAALVRTLLDGRAARTLLSRVLHVPDPSADDTQRPHIEDYRFLNSEADRVLLDRTASLTFLHLPIPHPEGIYDRATQQITTKGSTYIDNLALADLWLAHARDLLRASGQWDTSTVLLMGDHGWRTSLVWETMPGWTPEEERASLGGTFDTRPAYIVKLAGQTKGQSITQPFDAIRTRALVDALMTGSIQSPQQLEQWSGHRPDVASDGVRP